MVSLEPMSIHQFSSWLDLAIKEYAENKTRAGNVAAEKALEESIHEFKELLPEGLHTEDNDIFNVIEEDNHQIVGTLWIKIRREQEDVFIYGIRIGENYRGSGFGKQTLQALEALIKDRGLPPKVTLHVFGDNDVALKLYHSTGFVATNIRMSKIIEK